MSEEMMMRLGEILNEIADTAIDAGMVGSLDEKLAALRRISELASQRFNNPKNKQFYVHIKNPYGSAIEMSKNGRKIVGVIEEVAEHLDDESYPYAYYATVYEGNEIVFSISSCTRGLCFQRNVLKSAMCAALMQMTHSTRHRRNKKLSKGDGE